MTGNYKNTQIGYFLLSVFVIIIIIVFAVYMGDSISDSDSSVLPLTLLLLILFLINFSTLTVKVNRKEIIWYFGPGLWKFRIKVDEVKSAAITRAPIWEGVGIRWNPLRGMLYSVSGSYAVEIIRKNGKSTRIGTNEPRELLEAIQKSAGL